MKTPSKPSNTLIVDIQTGDDVTTAAQALLPDAATISDWLSLTYSNLIETNAISQGSYPDLPTELSIRIVSIDESQTLNAQYRGKNKPTNVLSFESDLPDFVPSGFLGDLVVCADIVATEASEQNKPLHAHWAHMCIHGMLHLLGFDHIQSNEADEMEGLEIRILAKLGIDDPYQIS